jgi:hypothetical protein
VCFWIDRLKPVQTSQASGDPVEAKTSDKGNVAPDNSNKKG